MKFILILTLLIPSFLWASDICTPDTLMSDLLDIVENVNNSDCPKERPIRSLCNYLASHAPDKDYEYMYRRKILEASCADPEIDSDEEIFKKIRIMWNKFEDKLVCSSPQFDTLNGNIIKFATSIHQNNFFNDVIAWGVNLNRVDPVDGMTVLDYLKVQIDRYHLEPKIQKQIKFYYLELRRAGAKHKSEL